MNTKQDYMLNMISKISTLDEIQIYLKKAMIDRGFVNETPQQKLLLLTEEVGELAKALRKSENILSVDKERLHHYTPVNEEVADVFIVLNSLCNLLNINLLEAFRNKENENITRKWS